MSSPELLPIRTDPRSDRLDHMLLYGLLIGTALAIVEFGVLGVGEIGNTVAPIKLLQRIAVYMPTAIGLLRGVPVGASLVRAPMAWFVAFLVWATAIAPFGDAPTGDLERMLWFSAYVLLCAMVVTRIDWQRLVRSLAVLGVAIVGAGLVAHVSGFVEADVVEFFEAGLFGVERVRGLTAQANAFGRIAAFTAQAGVILFIGNTNRTWRAVGLLSAVVGTIGVVASQSRFGLLSLCVGGAVVLARRWRWGQVAAVIGSLCAVALVLFVAFSGTSVGSRSGDSSEFDTVLGRTAVWGEAIDVAQDRPSTGVGNEGLRAHFAGWEKSGYAAWDPANGHSAVIHALAAHGVIGAMLLTTALGTALIASWRSRLLGPAGFVAMFCVQGLTEATLQGTPSNGVALFVAAVIVSDAARDQSHAR